MIDLFTVFTKTNLFTTLISIVVAVAPAIFWLVYIYKKDRHEKEPIALLLLLIFGGLLATVTSFVLETISSFGEAYLAVMMPSAVILTTTISAMLVGIIEESSKYFFLKKFSFNRKAFDYTFDGLVYAVYVSLGFALAENLLYVFSYGISVALPRALLTIPAHMSFGVYMGAFYGLAKVYDAMGDSDASKRYARIGLIVAMVLHGVYDALAMLSHLSFFYIAFYVFVVVLDILVYITIMNRQKDDRRIQEIIQERLNYKVPSSIGSDRNQSEKSVEY